MQVMTAAVRLRSVFRNSRLTMIPTRLLLPAVLAIIAFVPAAAQVASPEAYLEDVKFLSSPDLRGRGAGTPELDQAAAYIAEKFEEAGLQPAGENGYLQPFQVTTGAVMGEDNHLSVHSPAGERSLVPGEDYAPINFSSSGTASGQLVFAGYGIDAEEKAYDDYAHLDVQGKIAVVLRYEPPSFSGGEGSRRYTRHANLISKAINARNRGAAAVIIVNGYREGSDGDELIKFGSVSGPADAGIPMVQVKNDVVQGWLEGSGKSLRELQTAINDSNAPQSLELASDLRVELEVDVERKQAEVNNVIGYLPGETDEYVVIGAHYDHLGLGDENSLARDKVGQIHPGADDNASGTAGLIALAKAITSQGKDRRGTLFMAFAGEEIGLLGSQHWTEHPTKPLEDAVAMLNMDMIGRVDNKVHVGGAGTAQAFQQMLDEAVKDAPFEVAASRSGYGASDHTSFTTKGIPVLFFFSGLHADYHKPSDTWDKINAAAAVEVLDIVDEVADDLRAIEERPEFIREAAMASGDPHSGAPPGTGGGGGYGPYFGSIPDFAEVPDGVRFADIRPDSPAAKGGLLPGDIMTSFDGKPIKNLYDFTYALRDARVGQTVAVTVLRDGAERTLSVTLGERP
jgi:Peptidase family M28/PDZ domain/PA domain